jgi:hypothetical protein
MKFFTREWYEGSQDMVVFDSYRRHIASISTLLPTDLVDIATSHTLHDAYFRKIDVDSKTSNIQRTMRIGDNQAEYRDITVVYDAARLIFPPQHADDVLNTSKAEVLYDEIHCPRERLFAHAFLLWPRGEFEISFGGFRKLREIAAHGRDFVQRRPILKYS